MTTNMAESSGNTETGNGIGNETAMSRNVSKLVVSPPGFNGQPKRGHLIFDACFESGNLGRVDFISDFEYDLFIRPDTCNPRFRVWFNFTVENTKEYQRVIFNIVNFSKTKSLYRDGMSPVVKSTSRPKWQRLPSKNVYYYRCPDHRKNYVMSFAFCFDRGDDVYQFAYCYPYTYTRLQHYLENLDRLHLDYVHRELLGLSVTVSLVKQDAGRNAIRNGPSFEKGAKLIKNDIRGFGLFVPDSDPSTGLPRTASNFSSHLESNAKPSDSKNVDEQIENKYEILDVRLYGPQGPLERHPGSFVLNGAMGRCRTRCSIHSLESCQRYPSAEDGPP
ncbi:cytosolic carboxypeptidase 6 [Dendropsophus ebraccatus]|uniref:cytosolic carboxypeptidase 6 n=1 Tax=Dendropsophus ebraccatus TaxID=150705 RepID=UPI0038312274